MNVASWIILIAVVAWIAIAIKVAFFGGFGKHGASCHGGCHGSSHDDGQSANASKGNPSKDARAAFGSQHHATSSARLEPASSGRLLPGDNDLKLPSTCMGCSGGNCAGCAQGSKRYDIPTPIIRENV